MVPQLDRPCRLTSDQGPQGRQREKRLAVVEHHPGLLIVDRANEHRGPLARRQGGGRGECGHGRRHGGRDAGFAATTGAHQTARTSIRNPTPDTN